MDTVEVYVCYTVKIYKYKPLKNFKQGGPRAGAGSAFVYNIGKTNAIYIYRDQSHVVELLLQLENKLQNMQNNVETQHKYMYLSYILYIGSF